MYYDNNKSYVCADCHESFDELGVNDESYDDCFGRVSEYSSCCPSCGGNDYGEGSVYLNKISFHIAKKNHFNAKGVLVIKKGERYKSKIVKGYMVDDDGYKQAIFVYSKYVVDKKRWKCVS